MHYDMVYTCVRQIVNSVYLINAGHTHTHTHNTHIGRAGWGIAWFIDGTLIPELVVQRNETYTFVVYGGDDDSNPADYHPFYITDSQSGGRLLNTEEEQMVRQSTKH